MIRLWAFQPFLLLLGWGLFFAESPIKASSPGTLTAPVPKTGGHAKAPSHKSAVSPKSPPVKPPSSKTTPKAAGTTSPRSASTAKKKKTVSRKRSPKIRGQREIEPARVAQIQEALAGAGYYAGVPSGKWDENTTKAMRTYQDSNGFKATGKPDALSLKKLGL